MDLFAESYYLAEARPSFLKAGEDMNIVLVSRESYEEMRDTHDALDIDPSKRFAVDD